MTLHYREFRSCDSERRIHHSVGEASNDRVEFDKSFEL